MSDEIETSAQMDVGVDLTGEDQIADTPPLVDIASEDTAPNSAPLLKTGSPDPSEPSSSQPSELTSSQPSELSSSQPSEPSSSQPSELSSPELATPGSPKPAAPGSADPAEPDSSKSTAPDISSYFNKAVDDDPFTTISPDQVSSQESEVPILASVKLELPSSEEKLKLQEEDEERLYSPPITKDEMTDELPSVAEISMDPGKATHAELDRMYDAWIPSESTRRFLAQALAAGSSMHVPADKSLKPRLAMADTQADPVYLETFKLRGERETQKRENILNLSQVEHTMVGLQRLIEAECWRSALDLTAILLTNMGQGLQPAALQSDSVISAQSMKVWAVRTALLSKLKFYSIAEAECQQFSHMDSPELHFEFHPKHYPGRTGSMVPFSLRLLYACLPQFLGRHNESLDRLFHVRGQVNKILHNLQSGGCEDGGAIIISPASRAASMALWHQRELQVIYSLAGCLTDMKDFRLAITVYKDILARDPDNAHFTYSTMARLCLQMGALNAAESYFTKSVDCCKDSAQKARLSALHRGYLHICNGEYSQAPSAFSLSSAEESPSSFAKNNAAVSMLYNGQLKAGALILEELVMSDPAKYLQDTIATNLCTLYELESSVATAKKQSLLFLANQYKGNGFNINCLKMAL